MCGNKNIFITYLLSRRIINRGRICIYWQLFHLIKTDGQTFWVCSLIRIDNKYFYIAFAHRFSYINISAILSKIRKSFTYFVKNMSKSYFVNMSTKRIWLKKFKKRNTKNSERIFFKKYKFCEHFCFYGFFHTYFSDSS